jgi:hypothetical protein
VLQIRCWEVLEPAKYFPEDQLEVLQARRAERVKAREQAVNILAGLDDVEKLEMLKGEKDEKTAVEVCHTCCLLIRRLIHFRLRLRSSWTGRAERERLRRQTRGGALRPSRRAS